MWALHLAGDVAASAATALILCRASPVRCFRVGGLTFIQLGRLQFSFCIRRNPNTDR